MSFFDHQQRARKSSRRLIFLFALAVLAIVLVIDLIVVAIMLLGEDPEAPAAQSGMQAGDWAVIGAVSALTAGLILIASLFRILSLRGGGGAIARQLGGSEVTSETTDPLRRRLFNVVEEMSIASGVAVPEVYVLERESAINAFAAGHSPSDAAVAVTRGALEQLDRDELQGVIAHEFSHILNGDMRLNLRLIGILFGILALALAGRFGLRIGYHLDGRAALAAALIGLVVILIGSVGLLFGRLIQAAISRQREYLADASAVQFTRNPDGLSGALKRIGASSAGSHLEASPDEVSHMLFAAGLGQRLFATHPPLVERIKAIEPGFDPEELSRLAAERPSHEQARSAAFEVAGASGLDASAATPAAAQAADPAGVVERIGSPGPQEIATASALVAELPEVAARAAHSSEWAPELVLYLLLDPDPALRERQVSIVFESLGAESELQLGSLAQELPALKPEQRLPLLEMAFPALRRRPREELERITGVIDAMIHADGRVDAFEFALARLVELYLGDAEHPERARLSGRATLSRLTGELADLLSIVAHHGHESEAEAAAAFDAAVAEVAARQPGTGWSAEPPSIAAIEPDGWVQRLDRAISSLDALRAADKAVVVIALEACVTHAGGVVASERELMRAICASIHVPVPPSALG